MASDLYGQQSRSDELDSASIDDAFKRPKTTFMCMIAAAIFESPDKRLSLQEIYQYVMRRYPYYNHTNRKAWQNAVRHNLSLHDCFVKIRRSACIISGGQVYETTAHGGYWTLDAEAMEEFARYGRIKRRPSARLVKMPRRLSPEASLGGGTTVESHKRRGRPPLAAAVASSSAAPAASRDDGSRRSEIEQDPVTPTVSISSSSSSPLNDVTVEETSRLNYAHFQSNGFGPLSSLGSDLASTSFSSSSSSSSSSLIVKNLCDEVIRTYNQFP